jgi:hypothetical protein
VRGAGQVADLVSLVLLGHGFDVLGVHHMAAVHSVELPMAADRREEDRGREGGIHFSKALR